MGKLTEIKTKETDANVEEFLNGIADESKREDSRTIIELMKRATGEEPKMWGNSMIGFGRIIYQSPATGREVEWFRIGFSPRKANLSLHLMDLGSNAADLEKLGKHKTGKGCLYINKLANIDLKVLRSIIARSSKTG